MIYSLDEGRVHVELAGLAVGSPDLFHLAFFASTGLDVIELVVEVDVLSKIGVRRGSRCDRGE